VTFLLAWCYLPADSRVPKKDRARFDHLGTLLLALTLGAYALAMTMGRGSFGPLNIGLLIGAAVGVSLFVWTEARVASPLIHPGVFRDRALNASLAMNALVSTVMMATLVVGPFYLARSLGLDAALVGLVMSSGPIISAFSGVVAGRLVDRLGATVTVIVGLIAMAAGSAGLAVIPAAFGIAGYIAAIAVLTPGYQLFQAANNTAVMKDVPADQRGVISGILSLSRNLGLVTGASLMGAVFAFGSGVADITTADPLAVAAGMRVTFGVATALILIALATALGIRPLVARRL